MAQSQAELSNTTNGIRTPLDTPITMIARRIGGDKPKEMERFLKFAIVGISGAIVDFGLLIGLQATILPPTQTFNSGLFTPEITNVIPTIQTLSTNLPLNVTIVTTIAFMTAVINNFIWTSLWVYPDSQSHSKIRQLLQFTLISVTGGTARAIWVTTMTFRLGSFLTPLLVPFIHIVNSSYVSTPESEARIGSIIAQLFGMAVVMLWNFFANRYWTYNDVS